MWSSHAENLLPIPNSLIDVNRALYLISFTLPLLYFSPQKGDHALLAETSQQRPALCPVLSLSLASNGHSHPVWGQTSSTAGVSGLSLVF